MQHLRESEIARPVLRTVVCPACVHGPPTATTHGCPAPRPCEAECVIFQNIHVLKEIAAAADEGSSQDSERLIRELICNEACTRPTAGGYCGYRLNATCPLVRLADYVITALRWLPPTALPVTSRADRTATLAGRNV